MNKIFLDTHIVLYSSNKENKISEYFNKVNNIVISKNIWQISSNNNIKDTDHTLDNKIFYLPIEDNILFNIKQLDQNSLDFIKNKNNLKYELNNYCFEYILDYINTFELVVKKIKKWGIVEQSSQSDFHNDRDRDGMKHSFTALVAINDDYEGGEIQFKDRVGNELIKMSAGDVLIYPSNNNYVHRNLQVTSGTKYYAIAYF